MELLAYKNDEKLKVDKDNEHLLAKYSWGLDSDGYPKAKVKGKHLRLHQIVLGIAPKGMVTDHINQNKLDNRRKNLRFASFRDNALNSFKKGDGVWWNKSKERWQAQHKINGKRYHIGTFKTKKEALATYQKHSKELLKLLKASD